MSVQNRVILKSYFDTGDYPTDLEFANVMDSFWHKTDDTISAAWANITDKPTTFAPAAHVHSAGEINTGLFHPARLGAGVTTDGYMIQLVAGTPTWVPAPASSISGLVINNIPIATSSTTLGVSALSDAGTSYRLIKPYFVIQDTNPGMQFWKDGAPSRAAQFGFNNLVTNGLTAEVYDGTSWNLGWGITPAGNMGIKTAIPTAGFALDVNGDLAIGNKLSTRSASNLELQVSGTTVAKFTTPNNDILLGINATATSSGAIAIGQSSSANFLGIAIGYVAVAGNQGISLGRETVSGIGAFAGGHHAYASGLYSTAIGAFARSAHKGAFTAGDSEGGDVASYRPNSIVDDGWMTSFRGGYRFNVGSSTQAFEILSSGKIKAHNVPIYPDNTAALSGGETTNTIYRTPTGAINIVY